MWSLKILFFILFFAASTRAATLNCTFSGLTCPSFDLSPITALNEDITVLGAPFTPYIDNTTASINMRSYDGMAQHFTSMLEFPRQLFNIFQNLQSFYIEGGLAIAELGSDSVFNCHRLDFFNIFNSNIKSIGASFARTCSLITNMEIVSCGIEFVDENALEGLTSLKFFSLQRNKLTCIPSKLFQYSPNLVGLYFDGNKITALHSQIFVGMPKLSIGYFDNNLIGYIPNFNFTGTGIDASVTRLWINLPNNPIQGIHPRFLTDLFNSGRMTGNTNFVHLKFAPSSVSTCIPQSDFSQITGFAQDIYGIGNNTDWVRQNTTYQSSTTCYTAFTAEMGSDGLTSCLPPTTTTLSTSTTTLSTSTTESSTVTESTSSPTSDVVTYPSDPTDVTGTQPSDVITNPSDVITLPPNVVQCASDKICRYYLDWNNSYTCVIDGVEGTVTSISGSHYLTFTDADLTRLYFTSCQLDLVPKIIFEKFPNLKFLHIANCGLSVINDKTFNECGNLEFLDASSNNIIHVEDTALRNCTSLKIIDLTGNPIDFLGSKLYQQDPSLKRVHIRRLDDWTLA